MIDGGESPRERADRAALERGVADSELRGRPLPSRPRLGPPTLERYLAAVGGPLPYMVRLREIERLTAQHTELLSHAWRALADECRGDGRRFERTWEAIARTWDFGVVNALIDAHNRYYPAEARLPMDPRTGEFVRVHGRPYARDPLDAAWLLGRFPPVLADVG